MGRPLVAASRSRCACNPALRRPRRQIRASDLSGRVVAVGSKVVRFRPGDAVYGESDRAFAEYAPAGQGAVSLKPKGLSFEQAAAIPIAGQTALLGLRDHGQVQPGQHVLIIGAAGGVGSFAVQIAKAKGAEVTGVCSTRNVDLVASLGADHVIDRMEGDVTAGPDRYDVVFQLAGSQSASELRELLTPSGTLVLSSGEGGRWFGPLGRLARAMVVSPFVGHRLCTYVATPNAVNLAHLTGLVEAGNLTPVVDRTFPLNGDVGRHAAFPADRTAGARRSSPWTLPTTIRTTSHRTPGNRRRPRSTTGDTGSGFRRSSRRGPAISTSPGPRSNPGIDRLAALMASGDLRPNVDARSRPPTPPGRDTSTTEARQGSAR